MLTTLADLIQRAADALFVPWLLLLLFGTGLFLTIRYRFVQVRRFGEAYLKFGLAHPDEYKLIFLGANIPESIRKLGHRMPTDDPTRPGIGGALVFQRLVTMLVEAKQGGLKLNYPPDTCAELCWMGIHGVVAALILKPDFPWSNRDLLGTGMLDIVLNGVIAAA